jgi:hypothetical protein
MPEVSTHRILVTSLVYKVRGWYSASSRRKCFISRKNDLLPVKPRDGSLLPLSPKRTQVRLKSLLYLVWLTPESTPNPRTSFGQECRLRLKRPAPNAARRCPPFKSSTPESFRGSCSCGLSAGGVASCWLARSRNYLMSSRRPIRYEFLSP